MEQVNKDAIKKRGIRVTVLALILIVLVLGLGWTIRYVYWIRQESRAIDELLAGHFAAAKIEGGKALAMMSIFPDKKPFAQSLRFVQMVYACRRQFVPAEKYSLSLIDFDKKNWGEQSAEHAFAICDLALVYRKERRFPESEKLYRRAIEIYSSCPGQEAELARNQALLAWVLIKQNKLSEAASMLASSDQVLKAKYGENSFERLVGIVEKANIAKTQDRKDDALADMELAYKIATEPKPLETSSAQTVVVLNLLGQMFSELEQSDKALKLFKIAEDNCISSVFAGPNNTFMADILEPHAKLLAKLGQNKEAAEKLQEARNVRRM